MARRPGRAIILGITLSVVMHGGAAIVLMQFPAGNEPGGAAPLLVEFGVDQESEPGTADDEATPFSARPLRSGSRDSHQNIDATTRGGRGEREGAMEVILLAAVADDVTLQDSPMTAYEVAQSQRIQTDRARASYENRRATPNPADATYLASGTGRHPERRRVAETDPRVGAERARLASERGQAEERRIAAPEPVAFEPGDATEEPGAHEETAPRGGPNDSPGQGIRHGEGVRESDAARVASDRPPVDPGPAATTAVIASQPRDNENAELLAPSVVDNTVEATRRAGAETGEGLGGSGDRGAPGSGSERNEGGEAHHFSPGHGDLSLDTSDSRYSRWQTSVVRAIYSVLRFPRERALAMDQGWVVYAFRVRRDGSLAGPPTQRRSSRFDDIDQAAEDAILAAEIPPIPQELFPTQASLPVSVRISLSNPMVN